MSRSYWYLATEYTLYPKGLTEAYAMSCREAGDLGKALSPDYGVYSPIAHTHGIAIHAEINPIDHDFWLAFDEPMMASAVGLVVLCTPTWETSRGIAKEIAFFEKHHRPIVYMQPGGARRAASVIRRAFD